MTAQAQEQERKMSRSSPGLIRRTLRLALRLVLFWLVLIVVLSGFYWFLPPVSTLMIGDWISGRTVMRDYVPLDEISPHLTRAVITAEDSGFCTHSGIDWNALSDVIEVALRRGPSRGASTIAMQTSKNLFLLPSRSYIRKGLEIPLALYLDTVWSKRRMIEIYLNIAEWGDGIYGAEAAAQYHFRKPARLLTQREAALLAVALPNPILRRAGNPANYHRILAAQLMRRMNTEGIAGSCL